LGDLLRAHLREGRPRPQIGIRDVFKSVFLLFAQRLPSLNALEEVLRRRGRPLVEERAPSADTIGYAYARLPSQGLRAILREVCSRSRRRKALRHRGPRGPWTVAIDGHELFKSFHRRCEKCLERAVQRGEEIHTQTYHSVVVAHLVDAEPPLSLDAELIEPGEGEVGAARRLVARILRDYPFVEVFTFDALYLEAPLLKQILEAGRGAIVVLKEERRELYRDVQGLLGCMPAQEFVLGAERIEVWDIPQLRSWDALGAIPVRVVRTVRHRKVRQRIGKEWKEKEEAQDWRWATVGLDPRISALTVHRLGHARWDEEESFNEQDREFGLDHCFKHEPTAILNFLLTLFVAQGVTELFFTRNLKPPLRRGMTLVGLARIFLEQPPGPREVSIWAWAQAP
jgi:hypothetical protein